MLPASEDRLPNSHRPRRALPARACMALLMLLALCLGAASAHAALDTPRTLVVRGRVLKADGSPLAGARISARGTVTVAAISDDRGRFSINAPMGAPVSLKRGAFTIEIRAESNGSRLAYAAGGPALAIEVSAVGGTDRVRVRSNAAGATAAVITAFAQEGVLTAWVDADFGGAGSPKGVIEFKSVDEVALPGLGPAGTPPREKPQPPREKHAPLPPAAEPAAHRPQAPAAAAPTDRWRTRDSLAAAQRAQKRAADSLVRAGAEARRIAMNLAMRARHDSLAQVKAARKHADSLATLAHHAAIPAATAPATPAARSNASTPGCECRIRGTVEVGWDERPLEENLPVTLTLEGTNEPAQEVELYLGAPREFRFGPLPCGERVLKVRTDGRLRYTIGKGDSVTSVRCNGNTQVRIVLAPQKR